VASVTVDVATVVAGLERVRARIADVRARIADAGGDPDGVTIVAVTKTFGADVVDAAVAAGMLDVGESKAQELVAKAAEVTSSPRWHFIGRLQRNKVRSLAGLVSLWQSVDRIDAATEIARRAAGASVLVQVNVSDEPQKGGCPPDETSALVAAAGDLGLDVRGLMAVGATGPPEAARPGFRLLADLADRLALPVRSMGMTGDLEVAVACGSTMVRVGTALFGDRPPRSALGGVRH
jgi:PLP dependent protein